MFNSLLFSLCGFMSYLKHGQGKHAPLCSLKPAPSIPNIYQKYQNRNKTVYRIAVRGDPLKHFPCTYQESNQRSTIHREEFTHVDMLVRDRRLFQFELFYHFFYFKSWWIQIAILCWNQMTSRFYMFILCICLSEY